MSPKLVKRPESIGVGAATYEVRDDAEAAAAGNVLGACLRDSLIIIMGTGSAPMVDKDTLLHETLHGAWRAAGLDLDYPDSDKDDPGEKLISRLTPWLLMIVRDNPEFIKWLQS